MAGRPGDSLKTFGKSVLFNLDDGLDFFDWIGRLVNQTERTVGLGLKISVESGSFFHQTHHFGVFGASCSFNHKICCLC